MSHDLPPVHHGTVVPLSSVEELLLPSFRAAVVDRVAAGARIAAFFGAPDGPQSLRLCAVLADDTAGELFVAAARVHGDYPALTPDCPQAHWFEREIAEQWGIRPQGHPWLKPIRFHRSYRGGLDAWSRPDGEEIAPGVVEYFKVHGEEIHEVAVGPVHAGIIEPGHFRFQCYGENVLHLEIELGYQHRGLERRFVGGPDRRTIHYAETLAGDTTVGHALAYCRVLETLAGVEAPARAQVLRGVALELERVANHTGDLGALANDVGFLPTASYCGRIRGDFLNLTAMLCGNRFGRALVRPGGTAMDLTNADIDTILNKLEAAERDVAGAVDLLWSTGSVMARFDHTGTVSADDARAVGLVGPSARACGIERDVRLDFPDEVYRYAQIPVATWPSGDVFARATVRWLEIQRSLSFIKEQLRSICEGAVAIEIGPPAGASMVVSLVEGWRGEICHVATTDERGRFAHYKLVDPSFHNWFGLALSLRGEQISDFPLCNKSFNLSYCGHDL
ncbi:MAG: NADH-quinone oxidoreductase subunit C [Deltaproteobacteria bacterium]|nr:NADH-quinone oxidoreductase subunit C [Deltaproteobacteria bacterium]